MVVLKIVWADLTPFSLLSIAQVMVHAASIVLAIYGCNPTTPSTFIMIFTGVCGVSLGLGRIVALYHRSSISY
jgi:hypothetical protein